MVIQQKISSQSPVTHSKKQINFQINIAFALGAAGNQGVCQQLPRNHFTSKKHFEI